MRIFVNIAFLISIILCLYLWQDNNQIAIFLLAVSVLIYLAFNLYGSLYLSSNYFVKAFTKPISTEEKTAVITFDDGPTSQTEQILDVLKKHHCVAAFFLIGKNIEGKEKIVTALFESGHEIGNHSFYHKPNFPVQLSSQIRAEIMKTNEIIKGVIGKTPRFFRPPFGAMSPLISHAVGKLKLKIVGWNVRSFDTENDMVKTLERVKNRVSNQQNIIILLHDSTENIAQLLDSIIIYLKENNFKIIPLSDAFKMAIYEEN